MGILAWLTNLGMGGSDGVAPPQTVITARLAIETPPMDRKIETAFFDRSVNQPANPRNIIS